jgi:predicted GTPase
VVKIQLVANNNPYSIVADFHSFTLLTTAESFCRQKAAELGVTTAEQLVLRCIPSIAEYIKGQVSAQFKGVVPEGNLSPEVSTWYNRYLQEQQVAAQRQAQAATQQRQQQQQQQQQTTQTVFEIAVPIDNQSYTATFDITQHTPMAVAEALCSAEELNIQSLEVLVGNCLPQVAEYIRQTVNRSIAPRTIEIGSISTELRDVITRAQQAK